MAISPEAQKQIGIGASALTLIVALSMISGASETIQTFPVPSQPTEDPSCPSDCVCEDMTRDGMTRRYLIPSNLYPTFLFYKEQGRFDFIDQNIPGCQLDPMPPSSQQDVQPNTQTNNPPFGQQDRLFVPPQSQIAEIVSVQPTQPEPMLETSGLDQVPSGTRLYVDTRWESGVLVEKENQLKYSRIVEGKKSRSSVLLREIIRWRYE